MKRKQNEQQTLTGGIKSDLAVFGNLRVLTLAAMLCAMSVVLGYLSKAIFGTGPLRLTFENLPTVLGAISFGPFVGGMIAIAADLFSCLMAGQGPNPLIAVGSVSVGVIAGVLGRYVLRRRSYPALLSIELCAHLVGSVTLKSLALYTMGFALPLLLPRLPIYLGIAAAEALLLYLILKRGSVTALLERMRRK